MIRLFKVKEQQKENVLRNGGGPPVKKQTAGELRLNKDIAELNLPQTCTIKFPSGKDDLMHFEVYHPNIDLEGNVCLNILREDWKPVLNINTIIYGLSHLFTEPNHEDPLNHEAAELLRDNPYAFESSVRLAMEGGRIGHTWYTRCIENPYD
ncbi:hypothetical protein JRO89_XS08G0166600 [Xanthoceras sorbifolium]|uniref:UBC core domain-containing protein n=1 Tax=Xanthoceras sorbifolium TaxID=99658 RepID=A0ABQ8HQ27_9ROSI|nr:hypothetical protein JRO89_XS08G0166600 [Xanthoceras sorbifolium]